MITVEQLVEIAEEIELGDPIDWGMLSVNEHQAYLFLATSVLENYKASDYIDEFKNLREAIEKERNLIPQVYRDCVDF